MNRHYEHAGNALGPVTEEQLYAMRASGIIGPQDRVWRQDWPDWRRVNEVWPTSATPASAAASSVPDGAADPFAGSSCEECGAKDPGMLSIGGLPICRNCEPFARDKLSHGMPLGIGPWRDGKRMVIRKDVPLPHRCIKCAGPPTRELKKRLFWHHPAIYLSIFLGVIVYVVIAICVRKSATVSLPLCDACHKKRWRNIGIAWLSFFGSAGLFVAGGMVVDKHDSMGGALFISGFVVFLFFLIWAISIQIVTPKKIDLRYAWLAKVGRPLLNTLPNWPYS